MPRTTVVCPNPKCGGFGYIAFDGYFACTTCNTALSFQSFMRYLDTVTATLQSQLANIATVRAIADKTQSEETAKG